MPALCQTNHHIQSLTRLPAYTLADLLCGQGHFEQPLCRFGLLLLGQSGQQQARWHSRVRRTRQSSLRYRNARMRRSRVLRVCLVASRTSGCVAAVFALVMQLHVSDKQTGVHQCRHPTHISAGIQPRFIGWMGIRPLSTHRPSLDHVVLLHLVLNLPRTSTTPRPTGESFDFIR